MAGELVFLTHPDPAVTARLGSALDAAGYKVLAATSQEGLLTHLRGGRALLPDVVLLGLGADGGAPLLRRLRDNPLTRDIPVLLLAGVGAGDPARALHLGLTRKVEAPWPADAVLAAVAEAAQRAAETRRGASVLAGSLALLALPDLLQTLEGSRRTGVLLLRDGERRAVVWISAGQVIDAETHEGLRGEDAVVDLFGWRDASFEMSFGAVDVPRRIETSTTGLLLEAARRQDEAERDGRRPTFAALEDPPPAPPLALLAAHRALTLLNVATAYAANHASPSLLEAALVEARTALLAEHPALGEFIVAPGGQVALGGATREVHEPLVAATAAWLKRLFARLERAFPGRFALSRLALLSEAVHGDLESLGFYKELGLHPASTEHA